MLRRFRDLLRQMEILWSIINYEATERWKSRCVKKGIEKVSSKLLSTSSASNRV